MGKVLKTPPLPLPRYNTPMEHLILAQTSPKIAIEKARAVLAAGGLVLFPTETTYGAGVDATNQEAVNKLLRYKSRREGKPLSIVVTNQDMAEQFVVLNDQAKTLWQQFLPGPVTVVCQSKHTTAQGVSSEFETLGLRVPDYPLILDLVNQYKKPITATSANGSGKKLPYSIPDIINNLSKKQQECIDLILDAGELPHNPPSVVIDTTLSAPVTLRAGGIESLNQYEQASLLLSSTEEETKNIAKRIMLKNWNELAQKPLIIGLDGPLGVGKTIFAKGVAEFLQIAQTITSPTYSYMEEYPFARHQTEGMFFHLDMWKVSQQALFEKLELVKLLEPNHVFVIEWFDQVAPFFEHSDYAEATIVRVALAQEGENRVLHIL